MVSQHSESKRMNRKLFVQIPCLNEENTLPDVVRDLPKKVQGIDEIYTLVIDDGSTDKTVETAKNIGVDYIIRNHRNIGLAKSFNKGLEAALHLGADIIVNTDGDNQYNGDDIKKLIAPILEGKCDIVVGCRDMSGQPEFSAVKKLLQKVGSKIVRILSGTNVPDTTSGFRAMNRKAGIRLSVISSFSYTVEMLIQAGCTGLIVDWIPIRTNLKLRESRLFKSIPSFIYNQMKIMFAMTLFYRPMSVFGALSALFFTISLILSVRIGMFLWFIEPSMAKLKSGSGLLLIFTSIVTVLFFVFGLLGYSFTGIRNLIIDMRSRIRNSELQQNIVPVNIDLITANKYIHKLEIELDEGDKSLDEKIQSAYN